MNLRDLTFKRPKLLSKHAVKTVWIDQPKEIHCGEISHSHIGAYHYSYCFPHAIETKEGNRIELDLARSKCLEPNEIVKGVTFHEKTRSPIYGTKEIQLKIQIDPSACPVKILYREGSGEGGEHGDFFESEVKTFWVHYKKRG